jgi:hypothetical protein
MQPPSPVSGAALAGSVAEIEAGADSCSTIASFVEVSLSGIGSEEIFRNGFEKAKSWNGPRQNEWWLSSAAPCLESEIDVVTKLAGLTFEGAWSRRVKSTYGGVAISILGLNDLITNKRTVGRPQDSPLRKSIIPRLRLLGWGMMA